MKAGSLSELVRMTLLAGAAKSSGA
jgi:hypothetical protein